MGKIVIQAGMPKAGSSSVSAWLEREGGQLRSESGIQVCVAQARDGVVRVDPHISGSPNSAPVLIAADAAGEHRQRVIESFAASLDERAESERFVVLASEAFAEFFWRPDAAFLAALQDLAHRHEVHVAYYVRPQDTSFEAAWRQWGFRYSAPPSAYLASRDPQLRYIETYRTVRRTAPDVRFLPRPFRRDLLDGNVATDFDRRFLRGADAPGAPDSPWENQGLPLDVVRALRAAPIGLLWESPHDNRAMARVKKLMEHLDGAESDDARRSRRILKRYCYDLYEAGNRELISGLGWNTDALIQGAEGIEEPADLSRLDELWTSRASPLELALLHQAIAELVQAEANAAAESPAPKRRKPLRRLLRTSS